MFMQVNLILTLILISRIFFWRSIQRYYSRKKM